MGSNSCRRHLLFPWAISPGPSVMVVIRNTIVGGRSQGVARAIGTESASASMPASAVLALLCYLKMHQTPS